MSKIGDVIEYVDPHGESHQALVTASWDEGPTGARNLVYVESDESKHDSYGRQIARDTSVAHESKQDAPGRFWR